MLSIYLLLIYLLQRVNTNPAISFCFLLISTFSFSSTSMTNRATTKLIYQKQMFTAQKSCLLGCFNSIAKKPQTNTLLKPGFLTCDFTCFSSTKPVLVSEPPGTERVPLLWLAIPCLVAAHLFMWFLTGQQQKNACSLLWVVSFRASL